MICRSHGIRVCHREIEGNGDVVPHARAGMAKIRRSGARKMAEYVIVVAERVAAAAKAYRADCV